MTRSQTTTKYERYLREYRKLVQEDDTGMEAEVKKEKHFSFFEKGNWASRKCFIKKEMATLYVLCKSSPN